MKYHEAKNKIKTGDLLAFHGTWLMSRGIQWFTHSHISHVGIACWLTFNGGKPVLCVFESMEGSGVRILPLYKNLATNYWNKNGQAYWRPILEPYKGKCLMDFCVEHWNDAYASPYQFLLIASPRLRWLRKFRGSQVDTEGYHCSEIIATGLKEQGYVLPKDPPALVTPGDLYNLDCWGDTNELEYSSRYQVSGYREPV